MPYALQVNDYQKQRFVEMMIGAMFNTISGKHIAILGFAFKKVSRPPSSTQRAPISASTHMGQTLHRNTSRPLRVRAA